ncbi:reverse transcriptase domain-containing protein, partial [Tanacetum coccineum]
EVILNGNKVLKRTVREVEHIYEPTSAEEKQDRRNEMKARVTLLIALPNKDQLKFHSYKDEKLLMEAIKKRLQKLIGQLEVQGEVLEQEDIKLKLLRSLPSEWKTHALIWRNKEEIETIKTEDEGKDMYDWDQLLDFNLDDIQLLGEEELPQFVCKMGKSNCNKKKSIENLSLFYQDIGTSSSTGGHLTQEEAAKEALAIRMSQKFALLEEVKIELDGKSVKEEEEVVKRIKGEALKEEDDPGAFIFPIRLEGQVNENALADTGSDINTMTYKIYEQLGREEMKKVDRGITMINHTQAEVMGILTNVLCQVGVTTLIAKFLILDIPINCDAPIVVGRGFLRTIGGIVNSKERLFSMFDGFCHQNFRATRSEVMRNIESDSDDEEDYQIQRNKFEAPIYGLKPAPYLNCNDPEERLLAIQTVTNPFRKICVWKKAVSFFGSLPVPLKHVNWKPDYKGLYTKEEEATGQWRTKIRLTDPYGNIYIQGFTTKKTDRKLSKYHKLSDVMSSNWFME